MTTITINLKERLKKAYEATKRGFNEKTRIHASSSRRR